MHLNMNLNDSLTMRRQSKRGLAHKRTTRVEKMPAKFISACNAEDEVNLVTKQSVSTNEESIKQEHIDEIKLAEHLWGSEDPN